MRHKSQTNHSAAFWRRTVSRRYVSERLQDVKERAHSCALTVRAPSVRLIGERKGMSASGLARDRVGVEPNDEIGCR